MFNSREKGLEILYIRKFLKGGSTKSDVQNGDEVTLLLSDQKVTVRSIVVDQQGRITGTIHSFDGIDESEFGGLRIGQEVDFQEQHVFSCRDA